jgi:hypothetical protein
MSKKTLGIVGDSRMILREVALLFVVEKAIFPRRWMSEVDLFCRGDVEQGNGYGTVATKFDSL